MDKETELQDKIIKKVHQRGPGGKPLKFKDIFLTLNQTQVEDLIRLLQKLGFDSSCDSNDFFVYVR